MCSPRTSLDEVEKYRRPLARSEAGNSLRKTSWLAISALALLTGCSQGDAPPKLVKVHGLVVVDGEVAEGVVLALHPQPTGPALSTGISQSDGTFQISTYAMGDGAPVGSYQVTCVWSKFNPVTRTQEGDLLGGLYASAASTTLHFDIVERASHDAGRIELSTKGLLPGKLARFDGR